MAEDLHIVGEYQGKDNDKKICDIKLERKSTWSMSYYILLSSKKLKINEIIEWEVYTDSNLNWKEGAELVWSKNRLKREVIYKPTQPNSIYVDLDRVLYEKNGKILECHSLKLLKK